MSVEYQDCARPMSPPLTEIEFWKAAYLSVVLQESPPAQNNKNMIAQVAVTEDFVELMREVTEIYPPLVNSNETFEGCGRQVITSTIKVRRDSGKLQALAPIPCYRKKEKP